jgi:mono/diheme cytochrome c family protein
MGRSGYEACIEVTAVGSRKMNTRIALAGTMLLLALAPVGSIDRPLSAAATPSLDRTLVAKGAELAAIGNCATCHTSRDGPAFAGGLPLTTPFGTIYSTNITPDPDTGIGRWTEADFLRAMREGVDRAGHHLYPAFPYDHFTRVRDEDIAAIYAFIMTRDPVRADVPANRLKFPAGLRPAIAMWKALYFRPGVYQPDGSKSAQWNRGAYLVEGLAHCGACHTPRNALGAEQRQQELAGGEVDDWHASSLSANSPAPVPWTADQLFNYLRRGREERHGVAAGPMAPVTHTLAGVAEEDVRAIAVYVASQMPARDARARAAGAERAASTDGAQIFAGACANCHDAPAATTSTPPVLLGLTTSLNAPDPRNAIHVVLNGLWPEPGESGASMPGFASGLTDTQVVALVDYLRARFTDRPAWRDVPERVAAIRRTMEEER